MFTPAEVLAIGLAVAIAGQIAGDGESNWLEGVQLLAVYIILGIVFFFLPETSRRRRKTLAMILPIRSPTIWRSPTLSACPTFRRIRRSLRTDEIAWRDCAAGWRQFGRRCDYDERAHGHAHGCAESFLLRGQVFRRTET